MVTKTVTGHNNSERISRLLAATMMSSSVSANTQAQEALVTSAHGLPLGQQQLQERDALFRTLVQAHGKRLQRFILKNIGNASDAEDLAQQAFLEAVRAYQTFKGESELSTWLYGIAMNLVRNHLSRAPQRRYSFSSDDELVEMAADSLSPAQIHEQSQQLQHLQAALAELPPAMREVLLLVGLDELSYEEAAALLTVPVGTVRSRLSRARSALRAKLEVRGVELDF